MSVINADWVRVGMRLYSSMILTRIDSHFRQPMPIWSRLLAATRSAGSGLPIRSAIVICGWPFWIARRTSRIEYPASTPIRMALDVLPRPGPPINRHFARTANVEKRSTAEFIPISRSDWRIGAYSGRSSFAWTASTSILVSSTWPRSTRS